MSDQCPGCGSMRGCSCTPAEIRAQLVRDRAELSDRAAALTARSLAYADVLAAARAWDRRICWDHTDPDDEERALHEAVLALGDGSADRG